ncbi:glycosyltransferase [Wenzhouxiangella limi]|uniref:Glycosyltransferase n=1 Tax=Wenzhouxiangella limi TaxID=2707351 RepID=A0A845V0R0_9GAMM|nr:glycosyltransferase [Wenzhouxiangella limi]NDY96314.1 glycosyltransferase [Wenzhouxiangella limi]
MRILHIGKFFYPSHGGMENFLYDLLRANVGSEIDEACLVHAERGQLAGEQDLADLPFLERLVRVKVHGHLSYAPISPGYPMALERMLQDFRPDLLHLHLPNVSAFAVLFSRRARSVPWLVHWHSDVVGPGLERKLKLLYPFYRPFEQALLRRARRVIATSPPYLESSVALAPWRDKCQVVPLGLDPARVEVDSSKPSLWPSQGRLRVLGVGRLTRYKGFETLVRAALAVPEVELKIVGGGELRRSLGSLLERAGCPDQIELTGAVDDGARNRLLADCDLVCLPSINRAEAFGLILLEAMAAGKPVLVSDVQGSGMGWVVQTAAAGWLFTPANQEELAAKLRHIAASSVELLEIGRRAKTAFSEHFHISKTAGQLQAVWKNYCP